MTDILEACLFGNEIPFFIIIKHGTRVHFKHKLDWDKMWRLTLSFKQPWLWSPLVKKIWALKHLFCLKIQSTWFIWSFCDYLKRKLPNQDFLSKIFNWGLQVLYNKFYHTKFYSNTWYHYITNEITICLSCLQKTSNSCLQREVFSSSLHLHL